MPKTSYSMDVLHPNNYCSFKIYTNVNVDNGTPRHDFKVSFQIAQLTFPDYVMLTKEAFQCDLLYPLRFPPRSNRSTFPSNLAMWHLFNVFREDWKLSTAPLSPNYKQESTHFFHKVMFVYVYISVIISMAFTHSCARTRADHHYRTNNNNRS